MLGRVTHHMLHHLPGVPHLQVNRPLAMRDETKQPETYTTKKNWSKKLSLLCLWPGLLRVPSDLTLNMNNYAQVLAYFWMCCIIDVFYRLSLKQKACIVLRCLILITRKLWNFCLTWVDELKPSEIILRLWWNRFCSVQLPKARQLWKLEN